VLKAVRKIDNRRHHEHRAGGRSLTLLVSPSLRQSTERFRTVMGYFRKLSDAPEILAAPVTRLELANGSRIVSLPGTEGTIRG
jgi:hypothetical protein